MTGALSYRTSNGGGVRGKLYLAFAAPARRFHVLRC